MNSNAPEIDRTIFGRVNSMSCAVGELRSQLSELEIMCHALDIPSMPPPEPLSPEPVKEETRTLPAKLSEIETEINKLTKLAGYRIREINRRLGDMPSNAPASSARLATGK